MAKIVMKSLKKVFGENVVIPDADIEIIDKEFMVLVGPSGCGKSTMLNLIAGLEYASAGQILFDELDVTWMNPRDRNIAMVFQSYALYPHMNIYDNMAFGLKLSKMPSDEIDRLVQNAAKILQIEDLLDRKPKQLSGGQRQRVALGRAIVREPSVFLLDEPLSNLDAKLRVEMRAQIIRLHNEVKTTMIYVTHDQVEAMSMADRITILNFGNVMQVGTPFDVYYYPNNLFVAGFIGSPQMNFITTNVTSNNGGSVELQGKALALTEERVEAVQKYLGGSASKEIILGVRPEHLYAGFTDSEAVLSESASESAVGPKPGSNSIVVDAEVFVVEHLGSTTVITALIDKNKVVISQDGYFDAKIGENIKVRLYDPAVYLFDTQTEQTIVEYHKVKAKTHP